MAAGVLIGVVLFGTGLATAISLKQTRAALRQLQTEKAIRIELDRFDHLLGMAQFDWQGGAKYALDAADGFEQLVGPADRRTLSARAVHAYILSMAHQHEDAKRAYERCIAERIKHLGVSDDWTVGIMDEYVSALERMGFEESRTWLLRAAEAARDHLPAGNETRDRVLSRIANQLADGGDLRAAAPWYAVLVESLQARAVPSPQELAAAKVRLRQCRKADPSVAP